MRTCDAVSACAAAALPVLLPSSVLAAASALIAVRFGVYVYAPVDALTASVPYVPDLVTVPDPVPPLMPYASVWPLSRSVPPSVPVSLANVSLLWARVNRSGSLQMVSQRLFN